MTTNGGAPVGEECVTCAALPVHGEALRARGGYVLTSEFKAGVDYRPAKPRPIDDKSRSGAHGGPRSLRCATHYREHVKARRQAASNARSRKRSGLVEDDRQEVLAAQDGVCAGCGRGPGRKRMNLSADHDHDKAAEHEHPEDVACEDCMRGYLCTSCNRDILGMLRGRMGSDEGVRMVLANLHDYLADPPAQRVLARRRLVLDAAA